MRIPLLLAAICSLTLAAAAQQPCQAYSTTLIDSAGTDVGTIEISNGPEAIRVDIRPHFPRRILEVQIYAHKWIPVAGPGGMVDPYSFTYQRSWSGMGVKRHVATLLFANRNLACDDLARIAVHVVLCREDPQNPGSCIQEEAWSDGPNPLCGNPFGSYIEYVLCCTGCGVATELSLDADPLVTGTTVNVWVDNALPGETVWFGYNCGQIACDGGPSFGFLGGMSLDLLVMHPGGSVVADANGQANLSVPIPPPNAVNVGEFIAMQAVAARGLNGLASVKSNPILRELL